MPPLYPARVFIESGDGSRLGRCRMVHPYDFDTLILLPFVFGVAFMVWVLWNLTKQLNGKGHSDQ